MSWGIWSITGRISRLSQMWLPEVMQSTPRPRISSQISRVTPKPPAAFSTLAMQYSTSYFRNTPGSAFFRIARPGFPTTSPIMRMFMVLRRPGAGGQGADLQRRDEGQPQHLFHLVHQVDVHSPPEVGGDLVELLPVELGDDDGSDAHPPRGE